jgi:hypothetical protein
MAEPACNLARLLRERAPRLAAEFDGVFHRQEGGTKCSVFGSHIMKTTHTSPINPDLVVSEISDSDILMV